MPRKPLNVEDDYEPVAPPREQGEHPTGYELQAPAQQIGPVHGNGGDPEPQSADAQPVDPRGSRLRRGWSAANTQIDKNSDYAQAFKPDENVTYIIKFLEDGPYVSFNRHWVQRPSQKGGTVNVPFVCLRSEGIGKPCPLCDIMGDAPKAVSSFNIAVVERAGDVSLKSFDTTPRVFKTVQNFARDPLYTPITEKWWAVKKTKDSRGFPEISLTPVMSDASLHNDYKYVVPSPEEIGALELYGPEIVQVRSTNELMEIAKEQAAQDSYDPYGDT